jgi:hypothetical protein
MPNEDQSVEQTKEEVVVETSAPKVTEEVPSVQKEASKYTPKVIKKPVVESKPEEAKSVAEVKPTAVEASPPWSDETDLLPSQFSTTAHNCIIGLKRYVEHMSHLYPSYPTLGGQYMTGMYRHLVNLLHVPEAEFETTMKVALFIIKSNSETVFHDSRLARYASSTVLKLSETVHMRNLVKGLVSLADVKTRSVNKDEVNFDAMLVDEHVSEEARSRVLNFFTK